VPPDRLVIGKQVGRGVRACRVGDALIEQHRRFAVTNRTGRARREGCAKRGPSIAPVSRAAWTPRPDRHRTGSLRSGRAGRRVCASVHHLASAIQTIDGPVESRLITTKASCVSAASHWISQLGAASRLPASVIRSQ